MEQVLYRLEGFEGPLDLLLTLIQKNKVSIWDIPIVEITEQYLAAIEGIEDSELDNTSEFLVMAANLLWIKSRMLLPKNNTDEDEEDPREDLARRLAEYKAYKDASEELRKTEGASRYMVFREAEHIDFPIPEYSRHHTSQELLNAFANILARHERYAKPEKRAFSGIVGREKVSVYDMSMKIRGRLKGGVRVNFKSLFASEDSKPVMIATFLALLEMIKDNYVTVEYDYGCADFVLSGAKKTDTEQQNDEH